MCDTGAFWWRTQDFKIGSQALSWEINIKKPDELMKKGED